MTHGAYGDFIAAFLDEMARHGVRPHFKPCESIIADGKLHRFRVEGDGNNTRNGYYVLHADGIPAGEFGCWKRNVSEPWCARDRRELTPEQNREIQERINAARKEREQEQRKREGEAAKAANLLWQSAVDVEGDDHPYLQRKGVVSHGLRLASWPIRNAKGETFREIAGVLLVPVMSASGRIMSLQAIFPATDDKLGRDKDFLPGGKKGGGFFMIGRPEARGTVAICEGYATGATIHALTGWCVVVAFDAGNLPAVAEAMREALPEATFVVAADRDRWQSCDACDAVIDVDNNPEDCPECGARHKRRNAGVDFARRAVAACNGRIAIPVFASEDGKPTDFNDLAQREGDHVAAEQLQPRPTQVAALPKTLALANVEPINPDGADTYTPFPDVNAKGKPLATIRNAQEMLRRLDVVVRYNVISKRIEVLIPGSAYSIDNHTNAAFACLMSWAVRFGIPTDKFADYLLAIADANQYNPVATWIDSKPWDGRSRLAELYATVRERDDCRTPSGASLKETLIRKWLISAVAAAFSPTGVVARGVLTFQSKQNIGKTHWVKRLAPEDMAVIADGLILNPADRDSVKQCVSKWIVELGEVDATFRKADIAALKAFISKGRDELRLPYARAESEFSRRTIFFASVNDERFLHDETGNTRWWTIPIESLDLDHKIDVQQLWAEVRTLHQAGETWHLTREELETLNERNREHEAINPVHDKVDRAFDWDAPRTLWNKPMRATEIAESAGIERPTKSDVNTAAAYVTQRYTVERAKKGKERATVWMMPPLAHEKGRSPL